MGISILYKVRRYINSAKYNTQGITIVFYIIKVDAPPEAAASSRRRVEKKDVIIEKKKVI